MWKNTYRWFRDEKGAHYLIRLPPFKLNNKPQTTFAVVNVTPTLSNENITQVTVPPTDIEITTIKVVEKVDRISIWLDLAYGSNILPGLAIQCTQERSQYQNCEIAMKQLVSLLLVVAQERRCWEVAGIRGDVVEVAWGHIYVIICCNRIM